MELLSPVGSPDTVEAAVQSGANAVYLGFGNFNARRNAKNFSLAELEQAIDYCHLRGVSVFLTLNTLLRGRELPQVEETLRSVLDLGIDAVIVQDLGAVEILRQLSPKIELHASTQCSIHSLEGVEQAEKLGFSRVVLSRELSKDEIAYIAQRSPLPLEVFVHGAMCMSYSGQCYFSAMVGERSGNRGVCAQPCRLDYGWDGKSAQGNYPMSLKDMSLGANLQDLVDMGIASLKIEGRMKRPEYVAIVTKIYATALKEGRVPTPEEEKALEQAFSRQGFTQGYYKGKTGKAMFGTRQNQPEPKELFAQARRDYQGKEGRKTPITFDLMISDHDLTLKLTSPQGIALTQTIEGVEPAVNKALTPETATAQLQRTGGTPFDLVAGDISIAEGVALPLSKLNHLRREMLEDMGEQIIAQSKRNIPLSPIAYLPTPPKPRKKPLLWTVEVSHGGQITPELLEKKPELVYFPLDTPEESIALCQKHGIPLAVKLPSLLSDKEREATQPQLQRLHAMGIEEALVGTLDSYHWGKKLGFALRGDYNLNLYNSHSLQQLGDLRSAMPSFELTLAQIRDLDKSIPLELMAYGNLPLMTTKNCMIGNEFGQHSKGKPPCQQQHSLYDRKKMSFPVEQVEGGRNQVFNGLPLFLADKDLTQLGLWAGRLSFTRECPMACPSILEEYQHSKGVYAPDSYTRGLYYRGVD